MNYEDFCEEFKEELNEFDEEEQREKFYEWNEEMSYRHI